MTKFSFLETDEFKSRYGNHKLYPNLVQACTDLENKSNTSVPKEIGEHNGQILELYLKVTQSGDFDTLDDRLSVLKSKFENKNLIDCLYDIKAIRNISTHEYLYYSSVHSIDMLAKALEYLYIGDDTKEFEAYEPIRLSFNTDLPFCDNGGNKYKPCKNGEIRNGSYSLFCKCEKIDSQGQTVDGNFYIRACFGQTDNRDDIVKNLHINDRIRERMIFSKSITYQTTADNNDNNFHVLALELDENQWLLSEYIKNNPELSADKKIEIIRQLSTLINDIVGDLNEHFADERTRVAHRAISPDIVVIQDNDGDIKVFLSCFDFAKVISSQTSTTRRSKHTIESNRYTFSKAFALRDKNKSTSIIRSHLMDAYSTAKILGYLFGGVENNDKLEAFKNNTDISETIRVAVCELMELENLSVEKVKTLEDNTILDVTQKFWNSLKPETNSDTEPEAADEPEEPVLIFDTPPIDSPVKKRPNNNNSNNSSRNKNAAIYKIIIGAMALAVVALLVAYFLK